MSTKFGQCRLCPKNGPQVRIYGDGVCAYHLQNSHDDRSKLKAELTSKQEEAMLSAEEKRLLKKFYLEQARYLPTHCENQCGKKLPTSSSPAWVVKASICHIVEKRNFRSVMVHPLNRWFGCGDCHDTYDESWSNAVMMPVWKVCTDRFTKFMNMIKDTELRHLPDCLRLLIETPLNP